jgi:hypothetical protein
MFVGNDQNEMMFFYFQLSYTLLCQYFVEKTSVKVATWIARLYQMKGKKTFFWWGAWNVVNVLKFNRN